MNFWAILAFWFYVFLHFKTKTTFKLKQECLNKICVCIAIRVGFIIVVKSCYFNLYQINYLNLKKPEYNIEIKGYN